MQSFSAPYALSLAENLHNPLQFGFWCRWLKRVEKNKSQQMQEKFNPCSVDLWVLLSFVLPPPTPIFLILEKAPSTLCTLHWAR